MFHVEILFYLTRLLMNNVTLQLWPCSLIFNIVQVSTFYLFSHLIHISSKGKSPAKLLLSTGCVLNNSERPSYILRSLIMPRNALGFETITCHCFPHIAAKKRAEEGKLSTLSWQFYINRGKVWCFCCTLWMSCTLSFNSLLHATLKFCLFLYNSKICTLCQVLLKACIFTFVWPMAHAN